MFMFVPLTCDILGGALVANDAKTFFAFYIYILGPLGGPRRFWGHGYPCPPLDTPQKVWFHITNGVWPEAADIYNNICVRVTARLQE